MKKFVFELQNLQDLKQKEEDYQKVLLGKSEERLRELNNRLEALNHERRNTAAALSEEVVRSTKALNLSQYNDYLKKLDHLMEVQKEHIREENRKKSEILKKLAEIQKELKALEKLKEKKFEEYKKEEKKEEEKMMDDIVSFKTAAS